MDPVVEAVLSGSPWAMLLGLAIAFWRKDKAHTETHEARVRDAQAVAATLMQLMKDNNTTTQGLTAMLAAQANAIVVLTSTMDELKDMIDRLRDQLRIGGGRGGE